MSKVQTRRSVSMNRELYAACAEIAAAAGTSLAGWIEEAALARMPENQRKATEHALELGRRPVLPRAR